MSMHCDPGDWLRWFKRPTDSGQLVGINAADIEIAHIFRNGTVVTRAMPGTQQLQLPTWITAVASDDKQLRALIVQAFYSKERYDASRVGS